MYAIRSYYEYGSIKRKIDMFILEFSEKQHEQERDSAIAKLIDISDELNSLANVITSYSIHYTKLYDVQSSCNFSTDRVSCEYNPIQTSPDEIIRTIGRLGYRAAIPEEDAKAIETKKDFIRFAVSAFLTANVMMLSFALYSGFFIELTQDAVYNISVPTFVLAGIVLFYGVITSYSIHYTKLYEYFWL